MRVIGKAGSWKRRAFWTANEVVRIAGELPEEVIEEHYSGAGGAMHPSGKLRADLADDDVAYETLAVHLQDVLTSLR